MSNIVAFRPPARPWHCPHCEAWLLRGTVTERMHGETPDRCPTLIVRKVRQALREEAEATRAAWRRQDRERLRKARGVPIRRPSEPLPKRQPHKATTERIARLRQGLSDPVTRERILAVSRLPKRALSRVAAGRSTLASSQWRRIEAVLGTGARR